MLNSFSGMNKDFILAKKDKVDYIQAKKLLEYEDILTHAYTLSTYNNDFKKHGENDIAWKNSYIRLANSLDIPVENIIRLRTRTYR